MYLAESPQQQPEISSLRPFKVRHFDSVSLYCSPILSYFASLHTPEPLTAPKEHLLPGVPNKAAPQLAPGETVILKQSFLCITLASIVNF